MRQAIVIAGFLALAACNGPVGDGNGTAPLTGNTSLQDTFNQGFRRSFREKFVQQCTAAARNASKSNLDFTALCTCSADGLLAKKSAAELMRDQQNDPESEAIMNRCVREHPPV